MKRVFALLTVLALLLCAACAGAPETTPTETIEPEAMQPTVIQPGSTLPDAAEQAASPAAELSADERAALEAMYPVLDTVVRMTGVGPDAVWPGGERTEELWTALYLLGVNWCYGDPRISSDGAHITVPRQVMNEWAGALSEDFDHLPDLSPDITFLQYDTAAQTYRMELSDMGTSETRIDSMALNGDGTYAVKMGLYDEMGARMGGMDFVLIDNPFLAGAAGDPEIGPVENPVFLYTVRMAAAAE